MLARLKGARPSPALVISLIALFVSLGGVGYAAVTITGKNVKNSSLTGKDIKNSSLAGADVKNSRLTGADIKNNSLTGSDILESKLGKVGSAGTADAAGNANTVGGYGPSGLVRTAFAGDSGGSSTPVPGGSVTLLSTGINTPSSGFLLVTVNGVFEGTGTLAHCGIDLGDDTWPSDDSRSASVNLAGAQEMCSPTARLGPVAAGNHTVLFRAHNDGGGSLSFRGGSLNVLFVPFGSSGGQGSGAAARSAGHADLNR
jgi:hypothetical protein